MNFLISVGMKLCRNLSRFYLSITLLVALTSFFLSLFLNEPLLLYHVSSTLHPLGPVAFVQLYDDSTVGTQQDVVASIQERPFAFVTIVLPRIRCEKASRSFHLLA